MKLAMATAALTFLVISGLIWHRSYKKSDVVVPYMDDLKAVHITSSFGVVCVEFTTNSRPPYTGRITHPWRWLYRTSDAQADLRFYSCNEEFAKVDNVVTFRGPNGSAVAVHVHEFIVPDWAFALAFFAIFLASLLWLFIILPGRRKLPSRFAVLGK